MAGLTPKRSFRNRLAFRSPSPAVAFLSEVFDLPTAPLKPHIGKGRFCCPLKQFLLPSKTFVVALTS
jgi:hypothetical protein